MKKWFVVIGVLLITLVALTVSIALSAPPPPGCNGDIKTHDGNGEPSPIEQDHPKVCTFHLHGFNFDPQGDVHWRIETQPGGSEKASGSLTMDASGAGRTGLLSLPDGQYKVYWHEEGCPGGDKHKVFKVECAPPPVCEVVDIHYGLWQCGDWSECTNSEQTRECTREVWTTDHNDPTIECNRWTQEDTQSRLCGCNAACEVNSDCPGDYVCHEGNCRDAECLTEEDCVCKPPPPGPSPCNQPPTETGCKKGLVIYKGVCRNPLCLQVPTCICEEEVPCWPRLNIWVTGCFPEGLKVSVWLGELKIKDVPWDPSEGKPIIVDLDFGKTYIVKGWDEQGGFIEFGTITTPPKKQCGEQNLTYNFPCPTPTPPPEFPKELPVTGIGPPLGAEASPAAVEATLPLASGSMAMIVTGVYLLRKRR